MTGSCSPGRCTRHAHRAGRGAWKAGTRVQRSVLDDFDNLTANWWIPGQTQVRRVHRHPQHPPHRQFARSDFARLGRLNWRILSALRNGFLSHYSATYVINSLSLSIKHLFMLMTMSLGLFVGNRRSSVPSCTLEIRIQCVNEVLRCHRMSVGWAPVIRFFFVVRPASPSISLYFFLSFLAVLAHYSHFFPRSATLVGIKHPLYVRHEQTNRSWSRGSATCV